jgi:predicted HAD superfamily Cof-like phosphohydrolase
MFAPSEKRPETENEYEAKVRAFHTAFGLSNNVAFTPELLELRKKLIAEEVQELNAEIDKAVAELKAQGKISKQTLADMMKETADVQYVLSGMSVTFGLPISQVYDRVHESNMSKLGDDGKPLRRADGKVLKGPNYHPPVLDDLAGE